MCVLYQSSSPSLTLAMVVRTEMDLQSYMESILALTLVDREMKKIEALGIAGDDPISKLSMFTEDDLVDENITGSNHDKKN